MNDDDQIEYILSIYNRLMDKDEIKNIKYLINLFINKRIDINKMINKLNYLSK